MKTAVSDVLCRLLVYTGVIHIVLLSVNADAAWGMKKDRGVARVLPVLVEDGNSNNLGVFAGVVQTKDSDNHFSTAYLVMSQQGYLSPMHSNGNVAAVGPVFYQTRDCTGAEYVQVTSADPVFTGLPGSAFATILKDRLVYIPSGSRQQTIAMRSNFNRNDAHECQQGVTDGHFFRLEKNRIAVTGYSEMAHPGPLVLVPADLNAARSRDDERAVTLENDAVLSSEFVDYHEECSPGCLSEDRGDAACDIACYTAECSYDNGDCDSLTQSELDEMLRSVCSPGCFSEDINDGFCDAQCNVEQCNFDGDDCR